MKLLVCGFQKSGNHWVRFLFSNYLNIVENNATKTITWDNLEEFTFGIEYTHNAWDGQAINHKYEGYPEFFKQFDKLIYIYRNPFDLMISYYHWMMDRDKTNYCVDLSDFTRKYLPLWIHHIKITRPKADYVLNYDLLRDNPYLYFCKALDVCFGSVNKYALKKAVDMSSFNNIRKMSEEVNKPFGLYNEYRGYFCRNGKTGQYRKFMSIELINYIREECKKSNIEV